jgi:hypothetical protein
MRSRSDVLVRASAGAFVAVESCEYQLALIVAVAWRPPGSGDPLPSSMTTGPRHRPSRLPPFVAHLVGAGTSAPAPPR